MSSTSNSERSNSPALAEGITHGGVTNSSDICELCVVKHRLILKLMIRQWPAYVQAHFEYTFAPVPNIPYSQDDEVNAVTVEGKLLCRVCLSSPKHIMSVLLNESLARGLLFWGRDQELDFCLLKQDLYSDGKWILKEHGQALYCVCSVWPCSNWQSIIQLGLTEMHIRNFRPSVQASDWNTIRGT